MRIILEGRWVPEWAVVPSLPPYHAAKNDYSYKSEIKSKTIGLYQITGRYSFILNRKHSWPHEITDVTGVTGVTVLN